VQFVEDAPGLLHPDGSGGYIGYWDADVSISGWVSSALNNPLGWGRVDGLTFMQSSSATPRVNFHMVGTITGADASAIGIAYWSTYNGSVMEVELESAYEGNMDLVNHEAGHAFFWANHSPNGTDSIMEPMEDPGEEWPSDTDIAQVESWLGNSVDGNPRDDDSANLGQALIWFPGDLPHYITRWPVPAGSEARLTATVLTGTRGTLRSVYAETHAGMIAGEYKRFSPGIDLYHEGFYKGAWREAPAGEFYVGLLVHVENAADLTDLIVGLAEVQIR